MAYCHSMRVLYPKAYYYSAFVYRTFGVSRYTNSILAYIVYVYYGNNVALIPVRLESLLRHGVDWYLRVSRILLRIPNLLNLDSSTLRGSAFILKVSNLHLPQQYELQIRRCHGWPWSPNRLREDCERKYPHRKVLCLQQDELLIWFIMILAACFTNLLAKLYWICVHFWQLLSGLAETWNQSFPL